MRCVSFFYVDNKSETCVLSGERGGGRKQQRRGQRQYLVIFTAPTGAVAKYCDEYFCLSVCLCDCLCVCLSARTSPEQHVRSLPFLCTLPVSVARFSSDTFTISRIAYRRDGVFFPIDNAYISGTTRAIFAKFFMHVAYVRGSVLLRQNMFT